MQTVEVYVDITCPFTHVGLKRVVQHVSETSEPAEVVVRAWPLEWVNGAPLDIGAVLVKAAALTDQLGVDDFVGLRADAWPTSTIPTHDLPAPSGGTSAAVQADYDGGVARGVKGSPHFFVASDDFFCPTLDLGHDADGHFTARFDSDMLADFFSRIDAS